VSAVLCEVAEEMPAIASNNNNYVTVLPSPFAGNNGACPVLV